MQANETLLYYMLLNGIDGPRLNNCPQLEEKIVRVKKMSLHKGKKCRMPSEDDASSYQDIPKCICAASPISANRNGVLAGMIRRSPRTPMWILHTDHFAPIYSPSTVGERLFSLPSPHCLNPTYGKAKQVLSVPQFHQSGTLFRASD